ncbi:MAG: hypothetical protein ACFFE2_00290 [Candidatus Thorarchaeota archaeon]
MIAPSESTETDSTDFDEKVGFGYFLKWKQRNRWNIHLFIAALIATGFSCIHYLLTMLSYTHPGFALDDSWIHLQYARTIYEGTPWEYSPGYPSTGSTSPLWSTILSVLFYVSADPVNLAWCIYFISTLFYISSTFMVGKIVSTYTENLQWGTLSVLGFVLIPRNTWLMLSGMETPLFVFILLLSIIIMDRIELKYDLVIGVLVGLAYLSRPEGLVIALGVPVRLVIISSRGSLDRNRVAMLFVSAGLAILVALPWILHCFNITGLPLPDTFYAKVHAPTVSEIETWNYFWLVFLIEMPFLLVGMFVGVLLVFKRMPFPWLFPTILTIMYRLSIPYISLINNGRYLLPIFDLYFVAAIVVMGLRLEKFLTGRLRFKDGRDSHLTAIAIAFLLVIMPLIPTYVWQATNYGRAVENINDLQVNIGTWLAENTPEDAVFATHDAGALRFISNRTMIDMAGLVSPDIVHGNMTTREKLSYLRMKGCTYIVFFNDLFRHISRLLPTQAYETVYTVTVPPEVHVVSGRSTMSVYQIYWEYTSY